MKHKVTLSNQQSFIVDLPDLISDGQVFQAKIAERLVNVRWYRMMGQLQFIEAGVVERNCQILSRRAISFDGDCNTAVNTELVVNSTKSVQCVEAHVAPYVPGQDQRHTAQSSQSLVVRSQITGKILKVLVNVGDRVEPGMELVIIEAMKMENRVFSTAIGKILSVTVKAGDQVAVGKELLRLAP